jgi:hypothetical protein
LAAEAASLSTNKAAGLPRGLFHCPQFGGAAFAALRNCLDNIARFSGGLQS